MKERKKETKPRAPGAGRKKSMPNDNNIIDELVYPSLIAAFNCDVGEFGNRCLTIELSKADIKSAYGIEGLSTWVKYFNQKKIGGINRHGVGYKTTWTLNWSMYSITVKMLKSVGHEIKDLPNLEYPPAAMQNRLAEMRSKALINKSKRLDAKNALFLSTFQEAI